MIEGAVDGCIVMRGSYHQKAHHHQRTEHAKPEKQPHRGTRDDRKKPEKMFM
jgi:hypothetical protein